LTNDEQKGDTNKNHIWAYACGMKIGLQMTRFNWEGVSPDQIALTFAHIATTADALGFDSLWVMDHFFRAADDG
jgi:hypothetical protein